MLIIPFLTIMIKAIFIKKNNDADADDKNNANINKASPNLFKHTLLGIFLRSSLMQIHNYVSISRYVKG